MQAFLFPIVTSWQIPKLDGPGSGDIQQGQAGQVLAGLGGLSASLGDWALRPAGSACWGRSSLPPAPGADCALAGHADQQGKAWAGLLWAKDQGPPCIPVFPTRTLKRAQ